MVSVDDNAKKIETYLKTAKERMIATKPPKQAYNYFPGIYEQNIYYSKLKLYCRSIFGAGSQYFENEIASLNSLNEQILIYNQNNDEKLIFPENWDFSNNLRFLQGNSYDISSTIKSLIEHFNWRAKFFPVKITNKIIEILNSGFFYFHGRDNRYRPITIIKPHVYVVLRKKYQVHEWIQATILFMENAINNFMIPGQVEANISICDISHISILTLPPELKEIFQHIADNYRCRLYKMYILNVSPVLKVLWNFFKNLLHPNTQRKISMLSTKEFQEYSSQFIHKSQIEKQFGGTANNVFENYFPGIFPSDEYMTKDEDIHVSEEQYNLIIQNNPQVIKSPYLYSPQNTEINNFDIGEMISIENDNILENRNNINEVLETQFK